MAMQLLYTDTIELSHVRPTGCPIQRPTPEEIRLFRQAGFIPAVVVRPIKRAKQPGEDVLGYELLQGEKHWMLAQLLNVDRIPALLLEDIDDDLAQRLIGADLPSRSQLDPIDEAKSLLAALKEGVFRNAAQLARHLGLKRSTVHHRLRLLKLSPFVQQVVSKGKLSPLHVRTLVTLPYPAQELLANLMVTKHLSAHRSHRLVQLFRTKMVDSDELSKVAEAALDTLCNEETMSQAPHVNTDMVPDGTDEGSHQALLNVLNSNRSESASSDTDIADLERRIGDRLGYLCRIQYLPSGAGEIALRYSSGMKDFLQDDLDLALGMHFRIDDFPMSEETGWLSVVFNDSKESEQIINRLLET